MRLVSASDGLPARIVHRWSDEKLFYLEQYMGIFTRGMKDLWEGRLVYADFFAGPGLCIEEGAGTESLGSPLRALDFDFLRIFLNDADPNAVEALRRRTQGDGRVRITQLDCNDAVGPALEFLVPPGEERRTLGLAFIDPTAHQMRFEAIREFTTGVNFDLLITFMTNFPKRFISQPGFGPRSDFAKFIGLDAYEEKVQGRSRIETYELLDTYRDQLGCIGYDYVDDITRIVNTRGSTIYHSVFASRHQRGKDFFEKISQRTYSGQQRMQFPGL